jgi:hypothetical protein
VEGGAPPWISLPYGYPPIFRWSARVVQTRFGVEDKADAVGQARRGRMLALLGFYRDDRETSRSQASLIRWPWPHVNWQPRPRQISPADLSPHLLRDIGLYDIAADNGRLLPPDQASGSSNKRPQRGS